MTDVDHYRGADAVFTGMVSHRAEVGPLRSDGLVSTGDPIVVVFDVSRVYKGDVASPTPVRTFRSGASCGVASSGEGSFLVFAEKRGNRLHAGLCGGTRPLPKKLPAVLGDGLPPVDKGDFKPLPAAPGVPGTPPSGSRKPPPEWIVDDPVRSPLPWLFGSGVGVALLALPGWLALRLRRENAIARDGER